MNAKKLDAFSASLKLGPLFRLSRDGHPDRSSCRPRAKVPHGCLQLEAGNPLERGLLQRTDHTRLVPLGSLFPRRLASLDAGVAVRAWTLVFCVLRAAGSETLSNT